MKKIDVNKKEELEPIVNLVKECGELLKNATNDKGAKEKEDGSLVTKYDLMVDEKLTNGLKEIYGDIPVFSEEHIESFEDTYFIIDPIDGTHNFIIGLEYYGIMVAYVEKNEIKFSVIHLPILNKTFTAIKGNGAFLNGERISLDEINNKNKKRFMGCTNIGTDWAMDNVSKLSNNDKYKFEFRAYYCSCVPNPYVAAGILDFNIYWGYCGLWDILAPALIVTEAGGFLEYKQIGEGQYEIISGNKQAFQAIKEILK